MIILSVVLLILGQLCCKHSVSFITLRVSRPFCLFGCGGSGRCPPPPQNGRYLRYILRDTSSSCNTSYPGMIHRPCPSKNGPSSAQLHEGPHRLVDYFDLMDGNQRNLVLYDYRLHDVIIGPNALYDSLLAREPRHLFVPSLSRLLMPIGRMMVK